MKTNVKIPAPPLRTHEGAPAHRINPEQQLRRSLMACMLFEDEFYEDGQTIAERIAEGVAKVSPATASILAVEARTKMKLRHAPLWVAVAMARLAPHRTALRATVRDIVQRADELSELIALYWKDGKKPIPRQMKLGLCDAFRKFPAHQLAKYNRDAAIKLRDVMFLVHPKPENEDQAALWKQLAEDKLPIPDTWEVALSAGADKAGTFRRLISERKLGALALLRNLRKMQEVGIGAEELNAAIGQMNPERVLPFRFISAARYAPFLEPALESKMIECLKDVEHLPGSTILLVDVSGSMEEKLSAKSEMTRMDAACGLAMLLREVSNCRVFTFSDGLAAVPTRRGFALRDAITSSQPHRATQIGNAVTKILSDFPHDRLIVITDEQSHDALPLPSAKGRSTVINVASARNGVGYGPWNHIDGWSESVVEYVRQQELAKL